MPAHDNIVFKNYKVFYPEPVPHRGYRLLLLVREDFAAKSLPTVIRSSTMEIWLKLVTPTGPLLTASIYRQWNGQAEEDDLLRLDESLREFSSSFERVVILGDMNLDLARINDHAYYRRRLLQLHTECLRECGLNVANELDMSPTYVSHGTFEDGSGSAHRKTSVLDHVYYVGTPLSSFKVLPDAMTDHRPTLTELDLRQSSTGLKTILRRNFKSISTSLLCWTINAEALSRVFHLEDVEEAHRIIVEEINAALNIVAPHQEVQVKERRTPLYLSHDTLSLMRSRDAAAAKGDHDEYRQLRNRTARLVRRDKLASNIRHLQTRRFESKAIWNLANTASGRSQASTLPAELQDESTGQRIRGEANLADCVNKFYVDKIKKIREKIDANQQQQQQQQERGQQQQRQGLPPFKFRPPSPREVEAVVMSLNNTPAIGIDGIPVAVLKKLAPIIAAPLAHLLKISFEQAAVPSGFKQASVLPLHKKNKPSHLPSSYRPVAILPALSKIMEKVVLRQVSPHLAPLLPPTQFGFRPRRSTSTAIAYAHGAWAAARARGLVVAVAGFDLSSAFDTIDVNMVCSKLLDFGVEDRENAWFHDYLSGRRQQVQYNGSKSSFQPVLYGVPQGSILGPLLFLVLVADLPAKVLGTPSIGSGSSGSSSSGSGSSSNVEVGFSAYADDALCWAAGKSAEEVGDKLEHLSDIVVSFASENYLALNESKTQVLWCHTKGRPLRVGNSVVQPSEKIEVLGVSFDRSLSPAPYMTSLSSSAKALTATARRLSLHLPPGILKTVMGALYRGKIGYASLVLKPRLKPTDPTTAPLAQLQVGINDLARATIGANRCDRLRVEDLLEEAGFESVNRTIVYAIAMECWRALNYRDTSDGPLTPLGDILSASHAPSSSNRSTRSAASGCLPPPTKYQMDTFTWWAHTCWNASPLLRAATTLSAAKKAAKKLAMEAPI